MTPQRRLNTRINGQDCSIPINDGVGEHPPLYGAAELLRRTGGLDARLLPATWSTVTIRLDAGAEPMRVQRRISALAGDLLQMGMDASADGVPRATIPGFLLRDRGNCRFDADLYVEKADAEDHHLERLCIEAAARTIALPLARLAECEADPVIQAISTHVEQLRVTCRVDIRDLADRGARTMAVPTAALPFDPARIHDLIRVFGADSHQPRLTAEHNDHVLGAASAAAFELGLDHRRFELEARAHATRWGSCEPLAKWRWREHELLGQLQIPLDAHRWNASEAPDARQQALNGQTASELLLQVASVGLIASLNFVCSGLLGQPQNQRRRKLLPPPLPGGMHDRQGNHPPPEKVSSESGIHRAIPSNGSAPRSRTG